MNKVLASAALLVASTMVLTPASAEVRAPQDVSIDNGTLDTSLTGEPGDAEKGRQWFANRRLGNCLACHANADLSEELFHGEIGPELDGIADRYGEAELRAIIVNAKSVFGEQTIMPAFYSVETGARTQEKFQGKTILEAQQVEDVVAYLKTLKED